jgi:hypothetical protein
MTPEINHAEELQEVATDLSSALAYLSSLGLPEVMRGKVMRSVLLTDDEFQALRKTYARDMSTDDQGDNYYQDILIIVEKITN